MGKDTVVKVLRCVPSKRITINMACSTCRHHQLVMVDVDKGEDVCDAHGTRTEITEPSKWKCDLWKLDEEQIANLN